MKPAQLAPPFARRMAPLALVAGLVVAVVVPGVYERLALRERSGEARLWARTLAAEVEALARARPTLWSYDEPSLQHIVAVAVNPPVAAHVRLDARRDAVFEAGVAERPGEVAGWAPILADGRVAGRLQVRLGAEAIRESALWLWGAAVLGGLVLAAALFFLPVATVRRADARDAELWRALQDANAHLEARVEARTRELAEREVELSALGAQLVAVQEEERARISRDLHDELGQTLTGLRLRLTTLSSVLGDAHPGLVHLAAALSAVDDAVEEVRHLAHRLRPAALDGLGLVAALRGHAQQWAANAGVRVVLETDAAEPPPAVAEVLFRLAQEALTNVARHAAAAEVRVALGPFDDGWRLLVEDDGVGLAAPQPGKRRGLGLVGARERVEQAGGYLDVEPREGGGVRLVAWLPPA